MDVGRCGGGQLTSNKSPWSGVACPLQARALPMEHGHHRGARRGGGFVPDQAQAWLC